MDCSSNWIAFVAVRGAFSWDIDHSHSESESRTFVKAIGRDTDSASVPVHNLLANGKAQPDPVLVFTASGAPSARLGLRFQLAEVLEELGHFMLLDALALVDDANLEELLPLVIGHPQSDILPIAELYGVLHQVH